MDLLIMINSKEKLPYYSDHLGTERKDVFLWALRPIVMTEITKTFRGKELSSQLFQKLYALFRLLFTPERNVQQCRTDFFDLKREIGESTADVWNRTLDLENLGIRDHNRS